MAWRKPMVTVRDDPEALAAAACKKSAGRANCSRKWPSGGKEHAAAGILRTRALRREAIAQLRWRAKQDEGGVIYHLLLAMSRTDARIDVEHDTARRTASMDEIDPSS